MSNEKTHWQGDYLKPHVRQGRFMRELDEAIMKEQSRKVGAGVIVLIILACITIPPYRGIKNFFTTDKVQIVELNPKIVNDPAMQWAKNEEGEEDKGVYAVHDSVDAAEEWLAENGYRTRQILTSSLTDLWDLPHRDDYWKTFPVKGVVASPDESVVSFVIDYGTDQPRFVPFHYKDEDSPWDLSHLEKAVLPKHWANGRPTEDARYASVAFSLGVYSMHEHIDFMERVTGDWPSAAFNRKYEEEERERYYEMKARREASKNRRLQREATEELR